jgi:hypothetical protein
MAGILSLLIARPVTGAAWAQPAGHTYAKISGIFYNADEIYNDMGRRSQMGINHDEFDGRQMFLYVEYGLRERLTLVTQVNAGVLTDEDDFVRMQTTGIGDLDLGLKYQLVDRPLVVSPMLSIKIPTGYNAEYNPALGTGKFVRASCWCRGRCIRCRSTPVSSSDTGCVAGRSPTSGRG